MKIGYLGTRIIPIASTNALIKLAEQKEMISNQASTNTDTFDQTNVTFANCNNDYYSITITG